VPLLMLWLIRPASHAEHDRSDATGAVEDGVADLADGPVLREAQAADKPEI
jgi:hypothetical protein